MEITTELPEGYEAEYEDGVLTVEYQGEEVNKKLDHALVDVEVESGEVTFSTESDKRSVTSIVGSFSSHVENIIEGLKESHVYRMKGVYAHFPMTLKQEGDRILIENFMGERAPREVEVMEGVDVSIDGDDIVLKSADKEKAGQTAARIEQECHKGDRDPRVFQDGVYIVGGDNNE